jgi:ribosomal protein S21
MANTTVEVKKNANENNMNLMRRFSRKVQETGNIQKVKGKRYNERKLSKLKVKEATLKRLKKRKENERLFKLGKLNKTSRFTKK